MTDKFFKARKCPLFRGFTVPNDWKDNIDNPHNKFFLRRQGKCNRFIYFFDKETEQTYQ